MHSTSMLYVEIKKNNYKSIEIDNKVAWCGECCDCKSQTWVLLFKEGHMLSVILYDFFSFLESRENSLTTNLSYVSQMIL